MGSFPRVVAIFYAIFDPHKGAEILVQSPDEAITPPSSSSLFDFGSFSESIIPKKELCNKLINFCTPSGYRIVGYPVHIPDQKYERNFLIYNLAFVFQELGEIGSYIPVVERLALTFKQLEVRLPVNIANTRRSNRAFSLRIPQDPFFIMSSNTFWKILIVTVNA